MINFFVYPVVIPIHSCLLTQSHPHPFPSLFFFFSSDLFSKPTRRIDPSAIQHPQQPHPTQLIPKSPPKAKPNPSTVAVSTSPPSPLPITTAALWRTARSNQSTPKSSAAVLSKTSQASSSPGRRIKKQPWPRRLPSLPRPSEDLVSWKAWSLVD